MNRRTNTTILSTMACILLFSTACRLSDFAVAPARATKQILCNNLQLTANYRDQYPTTHIKPFKGVADWLQESPCINILMVPGMKDKDWHNYNSMIARMVKDLNDSLSIDLQPFEFTIDTLHHPAHRAQTDFRNTLIGEGELSYFHFTDELDKAKWTDSTRHLNIYVANWTTVTRPAKKSLIRLDQSLNQPEGIKDSVIRTHLSNKIKNDYFIDIFGDLALYRQPVYREAIHSLLDTVFFRIEQSASTHHPLICITGSMGSEIATNVFIERLEELNQKIQQLERNRGELEKVLTISNTKLLKDSAISLIDQKIFELKTFEKDSLYGGFPQYSQRNETRALIQFYQKLRKGVEIKNAPFEIRDQIEKAFIEREASEEKRLDFIINQIVSLKSIFMLNNQLIFTGILDFDVDSLGINPIEKHIADKLEKLISIQHAYVDEKVDGSPAFSGKDSLKVISFYDVNDILGFRLPTNELMQDIPISHSIKWTMNAQRLKNNFLYRYPLGNLKYQMASTIGQERLINALSNFEGPSEGAKYNGYVTNFIIQGHQNTPSPTGRAEIRPPAQTRHLQKTEEEKNSEFLRLLGVAQKATKHFRGKELNHAFAPDTAIQGIEAAFSQYDTVHVLTVHGMGSKEVDHFDKMAHKMAERMGFVELPAMAEVTHFRLNNFRQQLYADGVSRSQGAFPKDQELYCGIRELFFSNSAGKCMHFSIVHWSPISSFVKNELDELNRQAARDKIIPFEDKSLIHKTLKNRLVIDGFVDVNLAFGQGNFLGRMSEAVEKGVSKMISDSFIERMYGIIGNRSSGIKKNIFLISGSLGSRILFDHLVQTLNKESKPDVRGMDFQVNYRARQTRMLLARTRTWYMLNNQLSMISLKDPIQKASNNLESHVWHNLEKARKKGMLDGIQFDLIAFHDPNDILTFQLPRMNKGLQKHIRLNNMVMRTGEGIEVDVRKMYKFLRRVDRRVYRNIKIDLFFDKNGWKRNKVSGFIAWCAVVPFWAQQTALVPDRISTNQITLEQVLIEKMIKNFELKRKKLKDTGRNRDEVKAINQQISFLNQRLSRLKTEKKIKRKLRKNPIFVPSFLSIYEKLEEKGIPKSGNKDVQQFVLRLDIAHDLVKYNNRILDVICLGTPTYIDKGLP